jgi:predicted AAA+ superfamily ATPase
MKKYLKINNQYLIPFKERTSYYDKYKEVYKVDNKEFEVMETDVEMVTLEKLDAHDVLKILKESLLQLNKNRYLSQLNIVKPFEKYIELSKKAPEYLISKIC